MTVPTYQYACTACEHRFDAVQSFTDAALTECPECSGRLRKLYGSVGVVFKGSGFYRTDSRSGGKNGKSGSESPSKETSGKSETKSSGSSTESTSSSSPSTSTSAPAAKAS